MSKAQSRRTVSLNRVVFDAAKIAARTARVPLTVYVEQAIRQFGADIDSVDRVLGIRRDIEALRTKWGLA